MTLDVLHLGGKDPSQDFSTGLGDTESHHPPINYHAYAACTSGRFAARISDLRAPAVVVLLSGNLTDSLHAVRQLMKRGILVLISWKEAGRHQVAKSLCRPRMLQRFMDVSRIASGFLASTPWLVPIYRAAGLAFGRFVPTPYPLDFSEWDFRIPVEERSGIFLGTREFSIPSRNHAVAVFAACDLAFRVGTHVTCVNTEGGRGRSFLRHLDAGRGVLKVVNGKLPYRDYLRLLAQHQIAFQLDCSGTPGQVAGDAALCGLPCVGGDGAVDQVLNDIFAKLNGEPTYESILTFAHQLLTDKSFYSDITDALRRRALEMLSFKNGAHSLCTLATSIKGAS